jgi:plastocyanin
MLNKSLGVALLTGLFLLFVGLTQAAAPRTAALALAVVEIKSDGFHPQNVTIKMGGTVKWVNKDTKTHTVHFISSVPGRPDSNTAPIPPGQSVEVGFKASTQYSAVDHPNWKGTVTCQP